MDIMTTLYLIAALAIVAVALLGWEISGRWAYLTSRGLRRLKQADILEEVESAALPGSSLARRLREAGLPVTPAQFYLLSMGLAATGALLCWVAFIPGLPALASGAVMAYLPFAYVDERARSRGRLIDERLAIALSRLAPGLHTGRGLDQVLEEVAQSLQAEGPNPLAPELLKTARDLRTRDATDALRDLAKRSPSLSLANVAMLLESYLRAGGGQYAEVISETAVSIQRILAVRAHAQAKATQPLQSARWIPAMLAVVLLVMVNDPLTRASFADPIAQMTLSLAMAVMLAGYLYMRNAMLKTV